jgi:hypothetical protein
VEGGAVVSGNSVSFNEFDGIDANTGSTISGNTVYQNKENGIDCATACTIVGNSVYNNGNSVLHDGIKCADGCIVRSNVVHKNSGHGLNLATDSAYSDNVVTGNSTGTVTGAGSSNIRGGNYCAGTGTGSAFCP